jgi:hypothetical protein
MNTREFDEEANDMEELRVYKIINTETNPSTKLERRRRIEDLFEEKRLREEMAEFG